MTHIIDPFNDQHAIATDGELEAALYFYPRGTFKDEKAPTAAELQLGVKLGYGRFQIEGDD